MTNYSNRDLDSLIEREREREREMNLFLVMFIDGETSEALDLVAVLISRYIANAAEQGHVTSDHRGDEDEEED